MSQLCRLGRHGASAAGFAFWSIFLLGCSRNPYVIQVDAAPSIRSLGSDDLFEADPAQEKLVALGVSAVPVLKHALASEPAAVRLGVIEVLWRLQLSESDRLLIQAAREDPDAEVRSAAVRTLNDVHDPERVAAVESALSDPSDRVRSAAAQLCAKLCVSEAAIERLVEIALAGPATTAAWARTSLSWMLASRDGVTATATRSAIDRQSRVRLQSATDLDDRVRAALLLADIGDTTSVSTLLEGAARAKDVKLRQHALYVLGNVSAADAVPGVAALLKDPNRTVVAYSHDALRKMASRRVPGAEAELRGFSGPAPPEGLPRPSP